MYPYSAFNLERLGVESDSEEKLQVSYHRCAQEPAPHLDPLSKIISRTPKKKALPRPPLLLHPPQATWDGNEVIQIPYVGSYLLSRSSASHFLSISVLFQRTCSKMDERAAIKVTLPRPNSTISYWQDPPVPELADYLSSLLVPETADTVIIGSGITGSLTAWNLLQYPDQGHMIMLEARQTCSGATGRNGICYTQLVT
jgi:FAD dependent oxidoreductase